MFSFILRFKPACLQLKALFLCYIFTIFLSTLFIYNITRSPPICGLLFSSGLSIPLMASSQNTSGSTEPDSLNQHPSSGHQILLPSPFQGGREAVSLLSPFPSGFPMVPQPMGGFTQHSTLNMAPPNQFPHHLLASLSHGHPLGFSSTPPGQLPVGHSAES